MRLYFVLFYLLGVALVSSGCQGSNSAAPEEWFVVAQQQEQAKRFEEALSSYRKAAKRGHVKAQLWLGEYYERGYFPNQDGVVEGPLTRDWPLAESWYHFWSEKWYTRAASALRKSADQGDPSALTTLAHMYYKGAGVEKDWQEARKLWGSAADQQDPLAHYWLGIINRQEKSYTEALVRFERAAELGHLPAYEQMLAASHTFNLLDARKAISVSERQRFILRVRTMARAIAEAYYASREALGFPMLDSANAGKKAAGR